MLMRARVEPHSYTEHSPTDLSINGLHGEPENSEFRIQSNDNQRVESSRVTSVVLIRGCSTSVHRYTYTMQNTRDK